jgi:Reverse transcriptase (RNA-dependent DNA polymerase)
VSNIIFLVLYIDDILLIDNDIFIIDKVKPSLIKMFSMKDLHDIAFILSIKIYKDKSKKLIRLS